MRRNCPVAGVPERALLLRDGGNLRGEIALGSPAHRKRQAADMGGENFVRAALHGFLFSLDACAINWSGS